jgi:hypothetical protein
MEAKMTNRVFLTSLASAAVVATWLTAPAVRADSCVDEAAQQLQECKAGCKEQYQVDTDNCVNRDHGCMEICRAKRADCREATGLDAAIHGCNDALYAAKQDCRAHNAAGSPELDLCIDQQQVIAFQCRDAAREAARPALVTCRRQFRACAHGCPPANPPVTPTDKRQCRADAKVARDACKAGCKEEFQFLKDACLGRDHVCMEQCRANRDSCRQPIDDRLAAAIAACNATRDQAIDNCNAGPAATRDQCIDNAQVDAFQCRDQARENERPNYQACGDQFHMCVASCGPAQ